MKNSSLSVVILIAVAVAAYFVAAAVAPLQPLYLSIAVIVGGAIVLLSSNGATSDEQPASSSTTESSDGVETQTLYVGNLPYRANESAIRKLFSDYGQVVSVRLLKDKQTGKRRGFGFVEMAAKDAPKAVEALNEQEFQQRTLKVREANERKEA
ncbi:RNA-binding protein [Agarivorans sp. B2Z047]|uniref:RNA recognition motif domain-containing protein n=1 Tax=Agarivorans sp. B2Z047 TaxID=2652721 RepID=UPI00128CAB12|nr:RNA-binding protein [Agarivorans sp. B2Z047]MPW30096.1 RNA-binding protein [Agarivorans sp. B2Z047]UQN43270.1 RNA-binding protein [Agarivorans sp. B2Z047]